MDEHLKVDVWIHFVSPRYGEVQPPESLDVVVLTTRETRRAGKDGVCIQNRITDNVSSSLMSPYLSVNDKDQGSSSLEDHLTVKRGVKEVHLARKVPDLEVDKGRAGDVILVDFAGALQEQRLIGRHLMEYNLFIGTSECWFDAVTLNNFSDLQIQCIINKTLTTASTFCILYLYIHPSFAVLIISH